LISPFGDDLKEAKDEKQKTDQSENFHGVALPNQGSPRIVNPG
jgi:hypothetical protein